MDDLEQEIKRLIVEVLHLDGVAPEEIGSTSQLFGGGLGLDSIDALELGVALRKRYSLQIESVSEDIKKHFQNVRSLAEFVRMQKSGQAT